MKACTCFVYIVCSSSTSSLLHSSSTSAGICIRYFLKRVGRSSSLNCWSIWAEDHVSTRRGAHEEDIVRRMEPRLSRSQVCNAHESRIRKVAIRFLQQFDLSAWIRAPPTISEEAASRLHVVERGKKNVRVSRASCVEWYGVRAPPKTSLEAKITQARCR